MLEHQLLPFLVIVGLVAVVAIGFVVAFLFGMGKDNY